MSRIAYVNGDYVREEEAKISIFDRAFLFADAIYEVTAVLDGKLLDYESHLERLHRSLRELGMTQPLSDAELKEMQQQLIARNSLNEGSVYIQITRGVAAISLGLEKTLYLGNLDAMRDWGHARDYVEGMWMMLQQPEPDDYVLATGESRSVREFVDLAFGEIGRKISWQGEGVNETGVDAATGDVLVAVDPRYFRPTEVDSLCGDASKAEKVRGWKPKIRFDELVREMVQADLAAQGRRGDGNG
ncbi:MAG: GDP-mannose 4,6-dehydratase [Proteobacteria bacterium]|nr:GDP-mannose 4,6-dehydratase [Pseudomonadota bacterium]